MVAENFARIIPQMDRSKGRIFWRSFSPEVHSPILAQLEPRLIPDNDRVGWYMSQFCVDKVPETFDPHKLMCPMADTRIANSFLGDLKVMWIMATYGLFKKEKDSREFYRQQGKEYDGFREALLPDRDLLLRHVVPWTRTPKTWVSVGCGTARDIEYVVNHITECKTKVYLVDLSPALLDVAKERVTALGLEKYCTLVEGDITSPEILKKLPPLGTVDLVTCSYCLTMIPPWKAAAEVMVKLLSDTGYLALIDFTARDGQADTMSQRFYKWWFAHDGVWLNEEQSNWFRDNLKTEWYSEAESRLPYTFFHPTHYLYCGQKWSKDVVTPRRSRIAQRTT